MSRAGLTALVAGPGGADGAAVPELAAALRGAGVRVRDVPGGEPGTVLAALVAEDARDRADVVVVAGLPLLAATAAAPQALSGRVWAVPTGLPSRLELLGAVPPALADVAPAARWVLCPDEETRSLLDAGVPASAKRTVVLPLQPGGDGLDDAVRRLLDRTFAPAPWAARTRPLRVVVAGHALHFLAAVTEWLGGLPDVELRIDHVPSFSRQDEAASGEHAAWADTVVCEWASPVAAWYSRHKRPGQRLVVRLHRAELYSDWWKGIDIAAVDQVVCVSPQYARLTREITGWPADKVVVIPNYVDAAVLDRPKLPSAAFALGMMGVVPRRKRLDLGLDLLERLRASDPRFTLHVKSQMAWSVPWAWREPEERRAAEETLRRVRSSALLADGVVFDGYGPDVGAWLRKIGWVLSLSDDESFHLAPAEGMASGAVPVIRPWPGAETIYASRWIAGAGRGAQADGPARADGRADDRADGRAGVDAMAELVLAATREGRWDDLRARAREQVAAFDVTAVCERFGRILVEDLPADDGTPLMR